MLDTILSLSKRLISIKSDPGNKKELEQCLNIVLSELKDYTIERFEANGVKSALIYNTQKRPEKFKIILNGHLDVIPGKDSQYTPCIRNDRLYGVGALDMKSNLACLVSVFKDVAKNVGYPLALQIVTDEEVGGFNGTKHQIDQGVRGDFVIAGETTNFNIANEAKGILWVKISTRGKTAHGAYPWRGENAITKMNSLLTKLEKKLPNPKEQKWVTTINVSRIETSNASFNKIPDDCEIWLDIRYVPNETLTISDEIKKLLPAGFKMEIIANEPALSVKEDNEYIKLLRKHTEQVTKKKVALYGAQGSSDARHYSLINTDGIEFGPIGGGIGSDDEWINISSLEKYFNIMKSFLISIS